MAKIHPVAAKLLADIEAYRARAGVNKTDFGRAAAGNGFFIQRLEAGQTPRLTTVDRIYRYIDRQTKAAKPHHNGDKTK